MCHPPTHLALRLLVEDFLNGEHWLVHRGGVGHTDLRLPRRGRGQGGERRLQLHGREGVGGGRRHLKVVDGGGASAAAAPASAAALGGGAALVEGEGPLEDGLDTHCGGGAGGGAAAHLLCLDATRDERMSLLLSFLVRIKEEACQYTLFYQSLF